MNHDTPKWTPTLKVGVLIEFWIFREQLQGPKTHWIIKFLISLEKVLEHRCVEWVGMTHLDTLNTSYGQKKGRESNCQFDSQPLKVENFPDFLVCRWHTTHCWKVVDKGYHFASDLTSIIGLHIKLWASYVAIIPILGILGLPLRNLGTTWHLGVGFVAKHIVYYKGEGGGFPQGLWWVFWIRVCPCTKSVLVTH